jgi:hypothetical protein
MLYWKRGNAYLEAFDHRLLVSNKVRNELNGLRKLHDKKEVVYTEPNNGSMKVPYMPRTFPSGTWFITNIEPHPANEGYLHPFYINTDAWQFVEEWSLDANGGYDKPTGDMVQDAFYGLHFSMSPTTLGCIRIAQRADLEWLVDRLQEEKRNNNLVSIIIEE